MENFCPSFLATATSELLLAAEGRLLPRYAGIKKFFVPGDSSQVLVQ